MAGGQDLHLIARLQHVVQTDQSAVDARATAAVADVGMNVIGEIMGVAPAGKSQMSRWA